MRRVFRIGLSKTDITYLNQRKRAIIGQLATSEPFNASAVWQNSRQTKTILNLLAKLQTMAGERQRCMYCLDSHGSDIEHFWPKAGWPRRMFNWRNLLLACTVCGRHKGNRFPMDGHKPLLIDPSKDDPWKYLDFDPATGNLSARFDPGTDSVSRKGSETVELLHLDRRESLACGYQRSWKRINDTITRILDSSDTPQTQFITELQHADEHGLLGWVVLGTGHNDPLFVKLRECKPEAWSLIVDIAHKHH